MKLYIYLLVFCFSYYMQAQLPKGFVYLHDVAPSIQLDLRYCGYNNFVGTPIDGYDAEVCIVTLPTAKALQKAQQSLRKDSLSLLIYDSYRPQRAVNHFVRWAKQLQDTVMKSQFYPHVNKANLFKEGYIATKSRHSGGSTVDLTLVDLTTGKPLDMGTDYDYFGKASWVEHEGLTETQKHNRQLLQKVMKANGFYPYPKEWWHFTLIGGPFRGQYFDFPVE